MLRHALFAGLALATAAACSSPSHPPTTDAVVKPVGGASGRANADGGLGGPDDAGGDVLALDARNSGVACAAGVVNTAAELNVDQSASPAPFAGPFEIRGTVIFSQQVPAGSTVFIGFANKPVKSLGDATEQASGQLGAPATQVTYALHHQMAGVYYLMFGVDMNGDRKIGAGDLGGFFEGTTGTPIMDGTLAAPVTVANAPICGIDWGIGQIP